MSLVSALTPARLQDLADWGYERGVRYFEQGRVAKWSASENELSGTVVGSDEYVARLYTNGKQLGFDCTCPVGDRGQACKHVVALGLTFLADQQPTAPRTEAPVFATRDELEAFVERHHVQHELATSGEVLLDQLGGDAGARWVLGRLSLGAIGSLDGANRYLGARRLARAAAEGVYRRLQAAAADVEAGVAAEVTRLPSTPLARLLAPMRARIRDQAWPRASATGTLDIDPTTGAATWREAGRLANAPRLEARLVLVPTASITCTCKASACTHMLALIDRLLAETDPAIAEELTRPAWQRALAELAVVQRPKQRVEVWWQIEEELRAPTLVPIVRKEKKRGGTTTGARIAPDRLLAEHAGELSEQDLRIAEHLAAWRYGKRGVAGACVRGARRASARAARRPADRGAPRTARVHRACAAGNCGDELRLEPTVEGARFSPRLLAPLLELFAPGEPLIVVEPEHARCLLDRRLATRRASCGTCSRSTATRSRPRATRPLLERLARLEGRVPIAVAPTLIKGVQLAAEPTTVVAAAAAHPRRDARARGVRAARRRCAAVRRPASGRAT